MGGVSSAAARPPPPPPSLRHRASGETTEELWRTSEKSGNRGTRTYYHRRCKRRKMLSLTTNIESLPDDMVFNILVQLPAQDIYDTTRLVCSKWYHMIHTHHFVYEHLHRSTTGLLIQILNTADFVSLRQDGRGIEISKVRYKFKGLVWTSCNGLVLVRDSKDWYVLYIANPATKQHFILPTLSHMTNHNHAGLAYVLASMEYKAVFTYNGEKGNPNLQCAILTVGVDKTWRHVSTDHLSCTARRLLCNPPFVTEGFMHWSRNDSSHIVTLNVETETLRENLIPRGCEERLRKFFPMGKYLSLVVECSTFSWEAWEMKPETGEWFKLPNIDLEGQKCMLEKLFCNHDHHKRSFQVIGWLKYKEVMVFRVSYPSMLFIAYDVRTQEFHQFKLDSNERVYRYGFHVNSLVWLDGV